MESINAPRDLKDSTQYVQYSYSLLSENNMIDFLVFRCY
jgi:hypothetical protein